MGLGVPQDRDPIEGDAATFSGVGRSRIRSRRDAERGEWR
jgi:hypothetical protein